MKVVKQKVSLPIQNLDTIFAPSNNEQQQPKKHGVLFPDSMRTLICGPSNCGKSNVMLSLLFDLNGLKFENIYIFSKSLYQPKYVYLKEVLRNIAGVGYFPYNENDEIIDPHEAKPHAVFIFDDVACCRQEKIREYFSMGRHNFIDSFYLCQTYTRIPKHLIRDNANFIILFKQDDLNLKHVHQDHVGADMTLDKFKIVCAMCWKAKYSFLVIDKESDINKGRYRRGFDEFINVEVE